MPQDWFAENAAPPVDDWFATVAPRAQQVSPPRKTWTESGTDLLTVLGQGVIGVNDAIVGLGDFATGNRLRRRNDEVLGAVTPRLTQAQLGELYLSNAAKSEEQAYSSANGIPAKIGVVARNPAIALRAAVESAPMMLAGSGVANFGIKALGIKNLYAAAAGEGLLATGSAASQTRENTGTLTLSQSGKALASGALTAVLGVVGGRFAEKLGFVDPDVYLTTLTSPKARGGVIRQAVGSAISEGLFEELPQSVQEQILQNSASNRPLMEGVDQAAVLGTITGGLMGATGSVVSSARGALSGPAQGPPPAPGAPPVVPVAVTPTATAPPIAPPVAPPVTVAPVAPPAVVAPPVVVAPPAVVAPPVVVTPPAEAVSPVEAPPVVQAARPATATPPPSSASSSSVTAPAAFRRLEKPNGTFSLVRIGSGADLNATKEEKAAFRAEQKADRERSKRPQVVTPALDEEAYNAQWRRQENGKGRAATLVLIGSDSDKAKTPEERAAYLAARPNESQILEVPQEPEAQQAAPPPEANTDDVATPNATINEFGEAEPYLAGSASSTPTAATTPVTDVPYTLSGKAVTATGEQPTIPWTNEERQAARRRENLEQQDAPVEQDQSDTDAINTGREVQDSYPKQSVGARGGLVPETLADTGTRRGRLTEVLVDWLEAKALREGAVPAEIDRAQLQQRAAEHIERGLPDSEVSDDPKALLKLIKRLGGIRVAIDYEGELRTLRETGKRGGDFGGIIGVFTNDGRSLDEIRTEIGRIGERDAESEIVGSARPYARITASTTSFLEAMKAARDATPPTPNVFPGSRGLLRSGEAEWWKSPATGTSVNANPTDAELQAIAQTESSDASDSDDSDPGLDDIDGTVDGVSFDPSVRTPRFPKRAVASRGPGSGPAPPLTKKTRPSEILAAFKRGLNDVTAGKGVPVSVGRMSTRAQGLYYTFSRAIRMLVANEPGTFFHEHGHHLDLALFKIPMKDLGGLVNCCGWAQKPRCPTTRQPKFFARARRSFSVAM